MYKNQLYKGRTQILDKLQNVARVWMTFSDHKATRLDINNPSLNFNATSTNLKRRTQIASRWRRNSKLQLQTLEMNDDEKEHKQTCSQEENE